MSTKTDDTSDGTDAENITSDEVRESMIETLREADAAFLVTCHGIDPDTDRYEGSAGSLLDDEVQDELTEEQLAQVTAALRRQVLEHLPGGGMPGGMVGMPMTVPSDMAEQIMRAMGADGSPDEGADMAAGDGDGDDDAPPDDPMFG